MIFLEIKKMKPQPLDLEPEDLHNWYLEATKELNPDSYNPNAQKPFSELTEEQKFIDKFICEKIKQRIKSACEFYLRYKDNAPLFLMEHKKYIDIIMRSEAKANKMDDYYDIIDFVIDGKRIYLSSKRYNEWLFKFAFKAVLEGDKNV